MKVIWVQERPGCVKETHEDHIPSCTRITFMRLLHRLSPWSQTTCCDVPAKLSAANYNKINELCHHVNTFIV